VTRRAQRAATQQGNDASRCVTRRLERQAPSVFELDAIVLHCCNLRTVERIADRDETFRSAVLDDCRGMRSRCDRENTRHGHRDTTCRNGRRGQPRHARGQHLGQRRSRIVIDGNSRRKGVAGWEHRHKRRARERRRLDMGFGPGSVKLRAHIARSKNAGCSETQYRGADDERTFSAGECHWSLIHRPLAVAGRVMRR